MTDESAGMEPEWVPVLRDIARTSGHELRNALNGLMVNLEVVRSRGSGMDAVSQSFLSQAIEQAEETGRLAEGTIALLALIVSAINDKGGVTARFTAPRTVEIVAAASEAERVVRNLSALAKRTSLAADVSGGTVILSIPERTPDSN